MSRVFQAIKPHVPLIRFRKGGQPHRPAALPDAKETLGVESQPASISSAGTAKSAATVNESWALPEKFRRRHIDEKEIEAINMGGCDKPYE